MQDEIDHLLFEDKSMIRDYQAIQKTWFLRSKQRIIRTTGILAVAVVPASAGRSVALFLRHRSVRVVLGFPHTVLDSFAGGGS